ncbi:hypothetical protein O9G_003163 [Rozella allomycis CSF55]|uniref:Uncharacterized protein n=1 Tax=Rozella allomycis (strain CSF55) TaxID=988480 RepID=A0A075AV32_ROZAC|nr:hypothetical protein O9G_003163 [Rozella allomycis CSF55]|eukprot:EPZ34083.1 hypothetical protein O9G_003163 [Rozella allomycis CSF55]
MNLGGTSGEVQLKVLQILSSIVAACEITSEEMFDSMRLVMVLHEQKNAVVSNTAKASLNQMVISSFMRYKKDGVNREFVLMFYQDLCGMQGDKEAKYLKNVNIPKELGYELIESIFLNFNELFEQNEEMVECTRSKLCPLLVKGLNDKQEFGIFLRIIRLIKLFILYFSKLLETETSGNATQPMMQILAIEALRDIFKSVSLMLFKLFDSKKEKVQVYSIFMKNVIKSENESVTLTFENRSINFIDLLDKTEEPIVGEKEIIFASIQAVMGFVDVYYQEIKTEEEMKRDELIKICGFKLKNKREEILEFSEKKKLISKVAEDLILFLEKICKNEMELGLYKDLLDCIYKLFCLLIFYKEEEFGMKILNFLIPTIVIPNEEYKVLDCLSLKSLLNVRLIVYIGYTLADRLEDEFEIEILFNSKNCRKQTNEILNENSFIEEISNLILESFSNEFSVVRNNQKRENVTLLEWLKIISLKFSFKFLDVKYEQSWKDLINLLRELVEHFDLNVREQSYLIFHELIFDIIEQINIEGETVAQESILIAMDKFSDVELFDVSRLVVDSYNKLLQTSGQFLSVGWDYVLSILYKLSDGSKRVVKSNKQKRFCSSNDDLNISLTSIGLLWNVSDCLKEKPSTEIWKKLILKVSNLCLDLRPEVRNSAIQTLLRSISFSSSLLTSELWNFVFQDILISTLNKILVLKNENPIQDENSEIKFHHSRSTFEKQLDETKKVAIASFKSVKFIISVKENYDFMQPHWISFYECWLDILSHIANTPTYSQDVALHATSLLADIANKSSSFTSNQLESIFNLIYKILLFPFANEMVLDVEILSPLQSTLVDQLEKLESKFTTIITSFYERGKSSFISLSRRMFTKCLTLVSEKSDIIHDQIPSIVQMYEIAIKLHHQCPTGAGKTPFWKHAIECIQSIFKSLSNPNDKGLSNEKVSSNDKGLPNANDNFAWLAIGKCIKSIYESQSSFKENTSIDDIEKDEDFLVDFTANVINTILSINLPKDSLELIIQGIYKGSLLYNDLFVINPASNQLIGPKQPDSVLPCACLREKLASVCLANLFTLCCTKTSLTNQITIPFLLKRSEFVLKSFIERKSVLNRHPFERISHDEFLFILNGLARLDLEVGIMQPVSQDPVKLKLLSGSKAHLFYLYPLLCQCLRCDDHAITEAVQKCLVLLGNEMGLEDAI